MNKRPDWETEITPEDREIAASNGLTYNQVYVRIHRNNMNVDDAIRLPLHFNRRKLSTEIKANLVNNNINRRAFNERLRRGWTLEEASTVPLIKTVGETYKRKRVVIPREFILKAKENGIKVQTLYSRVTQYGWDIERAITQPVDTSKSRKKK